MFWKKIEEKSYKCKFFSFWNSEYAIFLSLTSETKRQQMKFGFQLTKRKSKKPGSTFSKYFLSMGAISQRGHSSKFEDWRVVRQLWKGSIQAEVEDATGVSHVCFKVSGTAFWRVEMHAKDQVKVVDVKIRLLNFDI